MSTNKHIDKICCVILAFTVLISIVGMGLGVFDGLGVTELSYENRLFDDSHIHTIDVVMDDWASFIETCENEEYSVCTAVIDGESFSNVAIRAKGNTSLSSVSKYGNNRYSFKIEFDHYDSKTYYGLDKLSLNNIIQDNTYMKDYLVYTLMREQGVPSPLCSFVNILINGEPFGVYLAVEGIEDSFIERNYGTSDGDLYKPDNTGMGGGRGNGKDFSESTFNETKADDFSDSQEPQTENNNFTPPQASTDENGSFTLPQASTDENGSFTPPDASGNKGNFGGMGGANGSDDVLLKYIDDDYNSYSNIFGNAKTNVTNEDKARLVASLKALNEGTDISLCVDIQEVIDYFVVHNFVCNFDSYTGQMIHNYYLYEENGILSMLPWDYNLAFGGFMSGADAQTLVNFPIDSPVSGGDAQDRPMIAWIFNNEEYLQLYHQRMEYFISNIFETGYFENKLETVYGYLSSAVKEDATSFCSYDEFTKGVTALKEFCLLRAESVAGQLSGDIPSTSQGQSENSSTLIDTGSLNVNDMGSMGMGGKKDFVGFNNNQSTNQDDASNDGNKAQQFGDLNSNLICSSVVSASGLSVAPALVSAVTSTLGDTTSQSNDFSGDSFPQMPNGNFSQGEAPQMPNGNFSQGEAPQMPNGNFPQGEAPQMPGGNFQFDEDFSQAEGEADNGNASQNEGFRNGNQHTEDDSSADTGFYISQEVKQIGVYLAISVCFLLFGLVFAKKFRRYKF